MEYTIKEEERIKSIQRYQNGEKPVRIYRSMGQSKRWFFKWLSRYKSGQKKWYKDRPKRPINIPGQTDEKIEQSVVRI